MPLTNPNKVVTEERLSEFYGQILPYMGGMPDVLANKFSKGDLYSTDEKMIGVWIDGKPVYQKTYVTTTPANNADKTINIAELNVDLILSCIGTGYAESVPLTGYIGGSGANYQVLCFVNLPNKLIYLRSKGGGSSYDAYVTIQYTKTTDSPIAIGSDTDYSTDEKIVGTWIDGSPVWQKTVATGGNVPSGATLILRTAMASTGYDTILYTK